MCTLDVQNYKVRYIYNVMYLLCCYRCCTTVSGLAVVENIFFFWNGIYCKGGRIIADLQSWK